MRRKRPKKLIQKMKCDRLWSQIIRQQDFCEAGELGECKGRFEAAHIIRRGDNSVRHDLENGLCLCSKHHFWFDKGDKFEVTEWFNNRFPGRKERLNKKNVIAVGLHKVDYEKVLQKLQKEADKPHPLAI